MRQNTDPIIKYIIDAKLHGTCKPQGTELTASDEKVRQLVNRWDSLEVHKGQLFHRWYGTSASCLQWVVPTSHVKTVLQHCHDNPAGGHFGFFKTHSRIRQKYFWPGMSQDVRSWCRACEVCRKFKGSIKSKAPLQQHVVGAPFDRLGVDMLGPFPTTQRGNKYVLVVVDYFTKWPEAIAVPNQEAETVAKALVEHVFSRNGVPVEIHTDQGRNFESQLFKEVTSLLGITKTRTTPLHPQSGGLVERMNRTMTKFLAIFVNDHQDDWDEKLPLFLLAYRSSPHATTGFSPAQLVFGRNLRLPDSLFRTDSPDEKTTATAPYTLELRASLEEIHDLARNRVRLKMKQQKETYDRRAKAPRFTVGDWVWVHDPNRKKGRCTKLMPQWTGPWVIVQKVNDVLFRVKLGGKKKLLHADRMVKADVRPEDRPYEEGRG